MITPEARAYMIGNLERRAAQHDALDDTKGADKYRRIVAGLKREDEPKCSDQKS